MTKVLSTASDELDKSKKIIKRLEEQQRFVQEFLNMKHFNLDTNSKLERYVHNFSPPLPTHFFLVCACVSQFFFCFFLSFCPSRPSVCLSACLSVYIVYCLYSVQSL